ncbi:hypothetical protein HPB47_025408 [Ixodes persulcatus]|uniref:Uncharacterized protein n=1 Tax=Ixodes persulcatus TaxID=34615 RepID=A0AC60Q3D5_IXOPE|nr:hypothetical protein HPB47_025408 [Ixodes persulcatus]
MLCAVPVRAYSLLPGPISYGVIQGVDAEITEDEIARNFRAEDTCCKIANVRRLGRSRVVKVTFTSTKLPSYTDRYNVTIVTDLATRKSPANVRRPAAVVGNTMTGRVLNRKVNALTIVARSAAIERLDDDYKDWTQVYTDASINRAKKTATVAITIPEMDVDVAGRLNFVTASTTAELVAIWGALESIKNITLPTKAVILTDCKSALQQLQRTDKRMPLLARVALEAQTVEDLGWTLAMRWISSHVGISGNERATHWLQRPMTIRRRRFSWIDSTRRIN